MKAKNKILSVIACAAMIAGPSVPMATYVHAEESHTETVQTAEQEIIKNQVVRHLKDSVMDGYEILFDGGKFTYNTTQGNHNIKLDEEKHVDAGVDTFGSDTYTCSCGISYKQTIPPTNASYTLIERKEATCTEDGYETYQNADNNETYTDIIPATGHIYRIKEGGITLPTCETAGKVTYVCEACEKQKESLKQALEQAEEDGDEEAIASAKDAYEKFQVPTITETIEAVGHDKNWNDDIYESQKKASCTEPGTMTKTCHYCKKTETKTVDPLGHNYELKDSVDATCEKAGSKTYVCSRCQDSYTQNIPALEHKMGEWYIAQSPSCEANGYMQRDCINGCGKSETEPIEKTGHNYVKKSHVEPTCTKDGYDLYKCENCGDTHNEPIAATGHKYESNTVAATCKSGGYTTHTCTVCGSSFTDHKTEALGHDYQTSISKQATCTENGIKTVKCTRCGESYTETIKATGHDYEVSATNATCTIKGTTIYKCKNCGHSYTVVGKALDHAYETKVISPTCTKGGYTKYTCTRCGEGYLGAKTKALGHDWKVKEKVDPTSKSAGYVIYECSRCKATYTQILDAGTNASDSQLLVDANAEDNAVEEENINLLHDGSATGEEGNTQYDEDGNIIYEDEDGDGIDDNTGEPIVDEPDQGSKDKKSKAPFVIIPVVAAACVAGGLIAFKKKKKAPEKEN